MVSYFLLNGVRVYTDLCILYGFFFLFPVVRFGSISTILTVCILLVGFLALCAIAVLLMMCSQVVYRLIYLLVFISSNLWVYLLSWLGCWTCAIVVGFHIIAVMFDGCIKQHVRISYQLLKKIKQTFDGVQRMLEFEMWS